MGIYSGKCDFQDHLWVGAKTEEEAFENFNGTKLYICQPLPEDLDCEYAFENKVNIPETYYKKVQYSSIKDLIPYYPHLIYFAGVDNTNSRNSVICLSRESFVDREEREILEYELKDILRIYNRCKRKKIEFNIEEVLKEVVWSSHNEESYRELANRVKVHGKKASINGIHLKMHEYYRKLLVGEMLKHGLNPVDYGNYKRFIDK